MDTMNSEKIVFAGGCFWGTEKFFKNLRGVLESHAGYANSKVENPTYEEVCSGETGAAEAVEVTYNATTVDLPKLVRLYFQTIDPTSLDRQGNDHGTQYRTGIYYTSDYQKEVALSVLKEEQKNYKKDIVTEVRPLKNFYRAEENHQDYLGKNPDGYCHIPDKVMRLSRESSILKAAAKTKAEDADTNYVYSLEENR